MSCAQTPVAPLMPAKPAGLRPFRALAPQDSFMAVLQGRLVTHLKRQSPAFPGSGQQETGTPLVFRRQQTSGRPAGISPFGQIGKGGHKQVNSLKPSLSPEGFRVGLSEPHAWNQEFGLEGLPCAWPEAQKAESPVPVIGAKTRPAFGDLSGETLPPALAGLLSLVEQSPGGVLPVPPSRQPEFVALLCDAGFSPQQAEVLVASPQVQEQGLTAEVLLTAWLKTARGIQAEPGGSPNPESLQALAWGIQAAMGGDLLPESGGQVTGLPAYRRLWERLSLPADALPDLRLALQQLGAAPEALAGLEEHATPQGIPIGQVWQVIKECLNQEKTDATSYNPAGPAAPPSTEEVAQWRQLLLQAGFAPEAVEGLLGLQPPASASELKARLAALAPASPPPEPLEDPKPLYLPEDLRLRFLWWKSRTGPEAGWGDQNGDQEQAVSYREFHTPQNPVSQQSGGFSSPPVSFAATLYGYDDAMIGDVASEYSVPEVRQAFWSQIEAGILNNLKPGESRLNLLLNPPHLGQIELTFNLKGGELAVTAMVSRPEVAYLAGAGVEQLIQALSRHGLMLSQFSVQVREGLTGSLIPPSPAPRTNGRKQGLMEAGEPLRRRQTAGVDRFI